MDDLDSDELAADAAPPFRKVVDAPKPRLRLGFPIALLVTMGAGLAILLWRGSPSEVDQAGGSWWATNRQHCTALEVDSFVRDPQLGETDRVVCLAVAGRIDRARVLLNRMTGATRSRAIAAVFDTAHPIADAGDDRSAGPIMALVVELWPENYMATFHAGMAEFALGHDDPARRYLDRFLEMYAPVDVWRQRAQQALTAIEAKAPIDTRVAHFAE